MKRGRRPRTDPSRLSRARHEDPASSRDAARRMRRTGRLETELNASLLAVCRHPGVTARDLHERTGLSTHLLGRRLPELLARGDLWREEHANPYRWHASGPGIARAKTIPAEAIALCRVTTPREKRLEAAVRESHELLDRAGIPTEYPAPEAALGRRRYSLPIRVEMLANRDRETRPPGAS